MKKIILIGIRCYQKYISRTPPRCRFYPTCSHYGYEAINRFGVIKGGWLTIKRILKCQPFHPGGVDPIPEALTKKESKLRFFGHSKKSDV